MNQLESVLAWLQSQQANMTNELIELCDLNSGSYELDGLRKTAAHLEDLMSDLGVACVQTELPNRLELDDLGNEISAATGPILRWTHHPSDRRNVLLAIHYDTVYGADDSFQRCERVDEGTIRGPGVIDAKGGIIVLRWALKAGQHFGMLNDVNWSVVLNPDEEIGSPSTWEYWRNIAPEFQTALLFEPSLPNNRWVSARRGTGNFSFVVHGNSAHAGRHFEEGRNAIVAASKIATLIHALNSENQNVTLNVGRVRGGAALNVVPDLCVVRINVRVDNADCQQWVEEKFASIVKQVQSTDEVRVEMHGGISSPPKIICDQTESLMTTIESVAKSIGKSVQWQPTGGASDGNKLASLGVPCIDTFGPEGDGLHSSREWCRVESLAEKAVMTLGTLIRESQRMAARL